VPEQDVGSVGSAIRLVHKLGFEKMNKLLATTALAAFCLLGTQASAATLIVAPGNWDEMLHNTADNTANTVQLESQPGGYLVDLTAGAGEVLDQAGNGGGFAQVDGPFSELTITPVGDLQGFSAIGFKLAPQKKYLGNNLSNYDLYFDLTFFGGGSQTLSPLSFPSNGKFDIQAAPAEVITSVKIYGLTGAYKLKGNDIPVSGLKFDDIKQISFNGVVAGVVPEPATWAMMIIGFGATGSMLRANRRRMALAAV